MRDGRLLVQPQRLTEFPPRPGTLTFEVEPTRQDEDVPWACNDVRYEIQRGDLLLSCSLGPAYHDIDLLLTRGGQALYQLVALSVKDIVYERDGEQELLRILISAMTFALS